MEKALMQSTAENQLSKQAYFLKQRQGKLECSKWYSLGNIKFVFNHTNYNLVILVEISKWEFSGNFPTFF